MSYLELRSVSKTYQRSGKRQVGVSPVLPVLRDINLAIRENEFVCIVGRSGSGKTTLISLIAGLIEAGCGRNPARRQTDRRTGTGPRRDFSELFFAALDDGV